MRIIRQEITIQELGLKEPYTIAYENIDKAPNVFLSIETDRGLRAFGCAAPDLEITGETTGSVVEFFNTVIEPLLHRSDPVRYIYILEKLRPHLTSHPSAIAMLDMCLFDLAGKRAGLPLYRLLGGYRTSIPTSITIGIMDVDGTLRKAREMLDMGFKHLKIKGGRNVEEDIIRVNRVRELAGAKTGIRFDANQGYTVDEAVRFVVGTKEARVDLLEQPTPKEKFDLLGTVTNKVSIPVMADESLMNLRDVLRMAREELIDMVNIKLMKAGGINEAMHINSVARAAGMEVMVGCMDESELAISAGLHFALARPNVHYADLDGHLDLLDDPFRGCLTLKNGRLYPTGRPGLGAKEG